MSNSDNLYIPKVFNDSNLFRAKSDVGSTASVMDGVTLPLITL